jgi:uncharacterized membrane protein
MVIYGMVSAGSAIMQKKGIFLAGGIKLDNFLKDVLPMAWRLLTTPTWLIGGIAALVGFLIYTFALNLYEVSIVKPLVNTNLLFTFIFAAIAFKERLSKKEWVGVGILVFGLILFAFSPNIQTTDEMNISLLLLFFPITIGLILLMILMIFVLKRYSLPEIVFPIFAGSFFGMGTFFTKSLLIGLNGSEFSGFDNTGLIFYSFWMLIITYGFATIAQQMAFEQGRLSIVSPIANALSIIIAFLGASFVFYEELIVEISGSLTIQSFFKVFGLFFILLALVILRREIDLESQIK